MIQLICDGCKKPARLYDNIPGHKYCMDCLAPVLESEVRFLNRFRDLKQCGRAAPSRFETRKGHNPGGELAPEKKFNV